MKKEKFLDNKLNYCETSFIVNAMNFYISNFLMQNEVLKKDISYYNNVIEKFEKLENKILKLKIDEGV